MCIPILVMTFPEWLSGTEPLPHTPGAVRPSTKKSRPLAPSFFIGDSFNYVCLMSDWHLGVL